MAEGYSNQIDVGPPPPLRKRRSYGWLVWLVVLLVVLGGGAYAWLNYDRIAELTQSAVGSASGTAPEADKAVTAEQFEALQQQTSAALQATTDQVAAQQGDLKRLSDQVEGLTARVAALASRLEQPQAAGQTPALATPTAMTPAVRAATAAQTPPRRRPAIPKPAGAISVGGAPLPTQPPQ